VADKQSIRAGLYQWVDPDRAELRSPAAVINAIVGRDTEYYPRLPNDDGSKVGEYTPNSIKLIELLSKDLGPIDFSALKADDLKVLRERYRESLNEVKAQTEYQDAKAARLLTIMSIFLAIAGMMFAKFVDFYPIGAQAQIFQVILVDAAYATFALFLLFVLGGAVVVFHASRTRFRYDDRPVAAGDKVRSRLFYIPISKAKPAAWAEQLATYVGKGEKAAGNAAEIDFLKDLVLETHLVACKANDKVRYMRPAQDLLWHAARIFLGWIILVAVTMAVTPRWKEPKAPLPPPPVIQVLTQSPPKVSSLPAASPPPRAGKTR